MAVGEAAIATSVPYVVISRSTVIGGQTLIDQCDFFAPLPPGGFGVLAPTSTVVVLESFIQGGKGGDLCFTQAGCQPLGPTLGAEGGVGVVADCLFTTPFDVAGGFGGVVTRDRFVVGFPRAPSGSSTPSSGCRRP